MHEKVITIYCLCADFLVAWGIVDDAQSQMSTAEVMTVVLVAAALFTGNQERGRLFLSAFGFVPKSRMLSKGRLNRRLHAIDEGVWQALFSLLAEAHKRADGGRDGQEYVIDSMPVPVCDNYRIIRCRIYRSEVYRGRISSKRRYFYGLRVHLVITATGKPVEFALAPGSVADVRAFQQMGLDLPAGSCLFADAAYTDYIHEDLLGEADIRLVAGRKKNSKRPHPPWVTYICEQTRKRVETTLSLIQRQLARHIHAVTPRGFELKVFLTVLAYSITA
jgi:hypothetical protein